MSEKIPFVERFGDVFKAATLVECDRRPARHGLKRFTSGWRLFVVAVVVLGGAGGALAATNVLSVNSGQSAIAPALAAGEHKGELLNIGAHNALPVGMYDTRDIQFAPGYEAWRRDVIQVNLADPSGQGPVGAAVMSTGDLRAMVEGAAACSWTAYWIKTMQAGDHPAAATAARHVEQAPALMAEGTIGAVQPSGLLPTIDAIKAGDVNLISAMLDTGGLVEDGSCGALGPAAVVPSGMSRAQYRARRAALGRVAAKRLLDDPTAVQINDQVMHSAPVETAIGQALLRVHKPFAQALVGQAPAGSAPLATRVGEQLIHEHPVAVEANTDAKPSGYTRLGPFRIGAQLLGISSKHQPDSLSAALDAGSLQQRLALTIGFRVVSVDPLAGFLNYYGVSY